MLDHQGPGGLALGVGDQLDRVAVIVGAGLLTEVVAHLGDVFLPSGFGRHRLVLFAGQAGIPGGDAGVAVVPGAFDGGEADILAVEDVPLLAVALHVDFADIAGAAFVVGVEIGLVALGGDRQEHVAVGMVAHLHQGSVGTVDLAEALAIEIVGDGFADPGENLVGTFGDFGIVDVIALWHPDLAEPVVGLEAVDDAHGAAVIGELAHRGGVLDVEHHIVVRGDGDAGDLGPGGDGGKALQLLAVPAPQGVVGVVAGILGDPQVAVLVGEEAVGVGDVVDVAAILEARDHARFGALVIGAADHHRFEAGDVEVRVELCFVDDTAGVLGNLDVTLAVAHRLLDGAHGDVDLVVLLVVGHPLHLVELGRGAHLFRVGAGLEKRCHGIVEGKEQVVGSQGGACREATRAGGKSQHGKFTHHDFLLSHEVVVLQARSCIQERMTSCQEGTCNASGAG